MKSSYSGTLRSGILATLGLASVAVLAACAGPDQANPAATEPPTPAPATLASGKLPEPSSWSFPDVVESARAITPRNVEGRVFNQFGLAYSTQELDALPVATMSADELQKYADIVTHAYPDAVFRQIPASCNDVSLDGMNTTAVAGIAFISIHAVELPTRQKATTCLGELQRRWKAR